MDFEITHDGMFAIRNASAALTKPDILELAGENFKLDLQDGEEYRVLSVKEVDDEDLVHWFLVPRSGLEEICRQHVESQKRG